MIDKTIKIYLVKIVNVETGIELQFNTDTAIIYGNYDAAKAFVDANNDWHMKHRTWKDPRYKYSLVERELFL